MCKIDLEKGFRLTYNDEKVFIEILSEFLQDTENLSVQMLQSLETESLKNRIHSLKGVSLNLGMLSLSEACNELENSAFQNQNEIKEGILKVFREIENARSAVENRLKSLQA